MVLSGLFLRPLIAASRSLRDKIRSGQHYRAAHSTVMLVLALILIGTCFVYALNNRMDRIFSGSLHTRVQQMAAAISDLAYDLDLGYASHARVNAVLNESNMTDAARTIEYMTNIVMWDYLLNKASHLDGITRNIGVNNGTLLLMQAEDFGMVDFFKLSFLLFGYRISSFFYTYFMLLGIGTALVFMQFWSRPGILLAANCLLFGLFLSVCQLDSLDTIANGRFFPTLALLPTLHLAVLIWAPPQRSVVTLVVAALQVLFLAFIVWTRGTAVWTILSLAMLCAAVTIWRAEWSLPAKVLVQKSITWPTVIFLLGITSASLYEDSRINPAYFALDETVPGHLFWHPMVYGLSFVDNLQVLVPELTASDRGDALPTALGSIYLNRIIGFEQGRQYFSSNYFPYLGRMRTYERVSRAAFFDFARRHPIDMLYFTFVTKPRILMIDLAEMCARAAKHIVYVAMLAVLFSFAAFEIRPSALYKDDLALGAGTIGGMALASCLPAIIAYPAYLNDTFAIWAAGALALSVILVPPRADSQVTERQA
jgi:hypothetical protein